MLGYFAVQVSSGLPTYAVTLGAGALPLIFGQGNRTQLGPILIQPGERVSLIVTGATALAAISGQLLGWQAPAAEELLPLLPLQPTAVTLGPINQWLGTFSAAQAPGTAILLPTGAATYAVGVFPLSGPVQAITGAQTGQTYTPIPSPSINSPGFFVVDPRDTSLTYSAPGVILNTADFVAYSQPIAAGVPVVIGSGAATVPTTPANPVTYSIRASAITTGALGAGGNKTVASFWHINTATKRVRLRRLRIYIDSVSAATLLIFELFYFTNTTPPSGGTAVIPRQLDPTDGGAEFSMQTTPTVIGATETGISIAFAKLPYGIVAGSVSDLYRDGFDLFNQQWAGGLIKPPTLRIATQEGWNLRVSSSGAATAVLSWAGEVTEE